MFTGPGEIDITKDKDNIERRIAKVIKFPNN